MGFITLYDYFIAISLLASLTIYWLKRDDPGYLKFFPPFLFVTLSIELYCQYLGSVNRSNYTIYNFFSTFEFFFYLWIIHRIVRHPVAKLTILIASFLYVGAALVNIFFIQGLNTFHSVTYCIGCLLVVFCCVYYFFEIFRRPNELKLLANPAFWICTGLLFFYCCTFPLFAGINYWFSIPSILINNFIQILTVLNVFLYTLFAVAFVCMRMQKYTPLRS